MLAPAIVLSEVPRLGNLGPLPKQNDLEKIKLLNRMNKSPCVGVQRESCKKKCRFPTIFGLRSPVIQKPFPTKSATSIVERVVFHTLTPATIEAVVALAL